MDNLVDDLKSLEISGKLQEVKGEYGEVYIVNPETGERCIKPTRRADGSYRKEIKIRPGYALPEEIKLYVPVHKRDSKDPTSIRSKLEGTTKGSSSSTITSAGLGGPYKATTTVPPKVQSASLSTRRGASSNYPSLKGRATPRDRGRCGSKDVTSSGSVIPVADLREAEGKLNREAVCKTTSGGELSEDKTVSLDGTVTHYLGEGTSKLGKPNNKSVAPGNVKPNRRRFTGDRKFIRHKTPTNTTSSENIATNQNSKKSTGPHPNVKSKSTSEATPQDNNDQPKGRNNRIVKNSKNKKELNASDN